MTPNPKQRAIVIQRFIEIAEVRCTGQWLFHRKPCLIAFRSTIIVLSLPQQLQRDDPDHQCPRVLLAFLYPHNTTHDTHTRHTRHVRHG
jgi:hypothetical protein